MSSFFLIQIFWDIDIFSFFIGNCLSVFDSVFSVVAHAMFLLLTFMPQSEYYFGNYLYEQIQPSFLFSGEWDRCAKSRRESLTSFLKHDFFSGKLTSWVSLKVTVDIQFSGPPELVRQAACKGSSRALLVIKLFWFGYIAHLSKWGGKGVFYLFQWKLPVGRRG